MAIHAIHCARCGLYMYDSDREERVYCAECHEIFNDSRRRAAELRDENKKKRDEIWEKYVEEPTRK